MGSPRRRSAEATGTIVRKIRKRPEFQRLDGKSCCCVRLTPPTATRVRGSPKADEEYWGAQGRTRSRRRKPQSENRKADKANFKIRRKSCCCHRLDSSTPATRLVVGVSQNSSPILSRQCDRVVGSPRKRSAEDSEFQRADEIRCCRQFIGSTPPASYKTTVGVPKSKPILLPTRSKSARLWGVQERASECAKFPGRNLEFPQGVIQGLGEIQRLDSTGHRRYLWESRLYSQDRL